MREEIKDNVLLRQLLWLRHGCPSPALYGDDGEMQCSKCVIDFLRDSPERIQERFREINEPELDKFFKAIKKLRIENAKDKT